MATIILENFEGTVQGTTSDPDLVGLTGVSGRVYVNGLDGADTIAVQDEGSNYINATVLAGSGTDIITGFGSGSVLFGNMGSDTITFTSTVQNVTVFGGQDGDFITGDNVDNSVIQGNLGNDTVDFTDNVDGSNTIFGGNQDDLIGVNSDDNVIFGDQGNDSIGVGYQIGGDNGTGFEEIDGGGGDGNLIFGNLGADFIGVVGSENSIFGGQNGDTVFAQGDDNLVQGNLGADFLIVEGESDSASVYGGQGNDTIVADGDDVTNLLVNGDLGSDTIFVGENADATVNGGAGNDSIIGSDEGDVFTGGADRDSFYVAGTEGGTVAAGDDRLTVTDFVTLQDRISFGGPAGTSTNYDEATADDFDDAVTLANAQFGGNGDLSYFFVATDTGNGYLFYNDGEGAGDGAPEGSAENITSVVELTGLDSRNDFTAADIYGNEGGIIVVPGGGLQD